MEKRGAIDKVIIPVVINERKLTYVTHEKEIHTINQSKIFDTIE